MATNEELKASELWINELIKNIKDKTLRFGNAYNVISCIRLYYVWRRKQLKQKCILLIIQDRGVL